MKRISPALVLIFMLAAPCMAQTIPVFTWNYQDPFPVAQTALLAKYAFVDVARPTAVNPGQPMYRYIFCGGTKNSEDNATNFPAQYLNDIARWDNARGHSMGNLDQNNPDLFLLDANGNRITAWSYFLLDIGNPKFWFYWMEAAVTDILSQPWVSTGLYIDGPALGTIGGMSAPSVKYPTDTAWIQAQIPFALAISSVLHAKGQKCWLNLGPTYTALGSAAWLTIDASPYHPDIMMEEGGFVTPWSSALGDFLTEQQVVFSLTAMTGVHNSVVAMASGANGLPASIGADNFGNPCTYWDCFYYGLACFLLGQQSNSYWSWYDNNPAVQWFNEFNINMGAAMGPYQVINHIYTRQFAHGLVVVNPTANAVTGIALGSSYRQVTHNNVTNPFTSPIITTLSLGAHRAAVLVGSTMTSWKSSPANP